MKKIKYYYNTHTLRYEKLVTPLRVKLLRLLGFLSVLMVSSAIVIYLYQRFFPDPKNLEVNKRFESLRENYDVLQGRVKDLQDQMAALEKRDNEVYRSIFEANPVPDSARVKLIEQKKEIAKILNGGNFPRYQSGAPLKPLLIRSLDRSAHIWRKRSGRVLGSCRLDAQRFGDRTQRARSGLCACDLSLAARRTARALCGLPKRIHAQRFGSEL